MHGLMSAWCHHSCGPATRCCHQVSHPQLSSLACKMVSWQMLKGCASMFDRAHSQLCFPTLQDGARRGAAAVQHADQPGQPASPGSHAGGSQPGHNCRPGHVWLAQRAGGHQPPDWLPKPPANAGEPSMAEATRGAWSGPDWLAQCNWARPWQWQLEVLDRGQVSSPRPQAMQGSTPHVQTPVEECRRYTTYLLAVLSMAEAI